MTEAEVIHAPVGWFLPALARQATVKGNARGGPGSPRVRTICLRRRLFEHAECRHGSRESARRYGCVGVVAWMARIAMSVTVVVLLSPEW